MVNIIKTPEPTSAGASLGPCLCWGIAVGEPAFKKRPRSPDILTPRQQRQPPLAKVESEELPGLWWGRGASR